MLYFTILYYPILYYTILYYTILCYTILCYTMLYYTILYYTILYYTILYYATLHYTALYYTLLCSTILYRIPASQDPWLPRWHPVRWRKLMSLPNWPPQKDIDIRINLCVDGNMCKWLCTYVCVYHVLHAICLDSYTDDGALRSATRLQLLLAGILLVGRSVGGWESHGKQPNENGLLGLFTKRPVRRTLTRETR